MIIKYDWEEIKQISKSVDHQVVLAYCEFANRELLPSKKIAFGIPDLSSKLHIGMSGASGVCQLPQIIRHKNGIFSNYTAKTPQSYFKDARFFFINVPSYIKAEYLFMLSMRDIQNTNNWIPKDYVTSHYYSNPLIHTENNKIIFKLENKQYYDRFNTTNGKKLGRR